MTPRINVDRNRCEGHALCVALVPDVFETDDEGKATVPGPVSDDQLDNIRLAVDTCPAAALRIEAPQPTEAAGWTTTRKQNDDQDRPHG